MAEGRAHSPRLRAGGNARPSRACRRRPQGWRRFLHLKSTDSSSIDRSAIGGGDDLYSQIQAARRKGLRPTLWRSSARIHHRRAGQSHAEIARLVTGRLGGRVGVAASTIGSFELGRKPTSDSIVRAIRVTLEAAGVEFISSEPGVKLMAGTRAAVDQRKAAS